MPKIIAIELPAELGRRIAEMLRTADALIAGKRYREAVEACLPAFDLLPKPDTLYVETREVLRTIGEANFRARAWQQAKDALSDAMHCPGALGDPKLHLRLGQCQYELGNTARAQDELARAVMGGGKKLFADEDPKYWAYITKILKAPPGGW